MPILKYVVLLLSVGFSSAATEEWLNRRMGELEAAKGLKREERLDVLAGGLQAGYVYDSQRPDKYQLALSNEAKKQILEIPGYADHFGKRITDSYERFKKGNMNGQTSSYYHFLDSTRPDFKTLALLPSAETVRVLGPMLSENWKWPRYDKLEAEDGYLSTLAILALDKLAKLPIANPPSRPPTDVLLLRENLGAWQQWYSEIESGRRTFRFIGDDTEYDLRGPVRRGAGMGSDRTGKRTQIATPGGKQIPEARPTPGRFLPYLIGVLVLLAGLGVYLRGKREHPHKHHSA
jgi:hypothetical protein